MKKILTNNGKILTNNGKILVANVEGNGGAGGFIEVDTLPEVGEENTVYKLASKLTQVPSSGYVERVYFNTNLSVEEVVSILETLNLPTDSDPYVVFNDDNKLALEIIYSSERNLWGILEAISGTYYFLSGDIGFGFFVGWNPSLESPIVVNSENVANNEGVDISVENAKLANLISTTPFVAKEEYYIYENGAWKQISGDNGIIEVDELPSEAQENIVYKISSNPMVVPNTGYVERVYLNKSLSFDEVNAICTKANNLVANETLKVNCVLNTKDSSKVLTVMKLTDTDDSTFNAILYPDWLTAIWSEKDYTSPDGTMTLKKGWNIEQDYLEINAEVVAVSEDDIPTPCGTYNDQLTDLFSLNGFFKTIEEYFVYEQRKPTKVPNSGLVENLYFNTKLSVKETDAILSQLTYTSGVYFLGNYKYAGDAYGGVMVMEANAYTGGQIKEGYLIANQFNPNDMSTLDFIYVSNQQIVDMIASMQLAASVGWNKEILSLNKIFDGSYGTENNKLINVISTTPYSSWKKIGSEVNNSGYLSNVIDTNYIYKGTTPRIESDNGNSVTEAMNFLIKVNKDSVEVILANLIYCKYYKNVGFKYSSSSLKKYTANQFFDNRGANYIVIPEPLMFSVSNNSLTSQLLNFEFKLDGSQAKLKGIYKEEVLFNKQSNNAEWNSLISSLGVPEITEDTVV